MRRGVIALGALGALGVIGCGAQASLHVGVGAPGYLAAFAFLTSTVLGGSLLLMVAELSSASWFVVLRRLAEALAGVTPLVAVAFVPLALALPALYPWARSFDGLDETLRRSLEHARGWMNPPLFLGRSALIIVLWIALAEGLRRASLGEDAGQGEGSKRRLTRLSALGVPLVAFTGSLAIFDWFMSALPGFTSNILGLYVLCGGFASAMGVVCVAFHVARKRALFPSRVAHYHTHALGRMLLMSVCLWAYIAVSQLVIVWSANLPKEAGFYLARYRGPFRALAIGLVFAHFLLPFLLLLSRWLKQRSLALALLGGLIVLMHAVDMYWLLAPVSPRAASFVDCAPFLLLGAVAASFGLWRFSRAPRVPTQAAELERSLAYESP
ncbi:MAG TPA: hypothetical protein VFQ35_22170 [Polyangiaceae bacterium]|nr:hypothetical protein [Polyangiaceae bacterium]